MERRWVPVLVGLLLLLLVAGAVRGFREVDGEHTGPPAAPEDPAEFGESLHRVGTGAIPPLQTPDGRSSDRPEAGSGAQETALTRGRQPTVPAVEVSRDVGKVHPASGEAPAGYFPKLDGKVVDVLTGKPVAGARVIYGPFPRWWGDDAGEDGAFGFEVKPRNLDPERPFRIRISAPGYEPLDLMPREQNLVVALTPRGAPLTPGRIRGRALDHDGIPVRGVTTVVLGDEVARRHWLAVLADEHGEFLLVGVPPGSWLVSVGRGDPINVFVPENGEAETVLRAALPRERIEAARFDKDDAAKLAELSDRLDSAMVHLDHLKSAGSPHGDAEVRVAILYNLVQPMEVAKRNAAKRRSVRVTGLAGHEDTVLMAEFFGRASTERWWAVVREGAAEFPALFTGAWHLTLKSPGGEIEAGVKISEKADAVLFPAEALPR